MFLFLSSSAFGLHWRQSVFGMALGLGMFAAVELVADTMIGHVGPASLRRFLTWHAVFAFGISLLIWLGYLLAPGTCNQQRGASQAGPVGAMESRSDGAN